jgi:hypothetical protein
MVASTSATRPEMRVEEDMRKSLLVLAIVGVLVGVMAAPALARTNGRGGDGQPVVYVTSQSLAYDSIVLTDLPFRENAPFQKLEMGGPTGLQTEFGPGDQGYVGGRWWLDMNGNDEMDAGDKYFICPLLGPGQTLIG